MKKLLALAAVLLSVLLIACTRNTSEEDNQTVYTAPKRETNFIVTEQMVYSTTEIREPISVSPPCPLTETEYRLLAELMTCEAEVVIWDGEKWGVSPYCRVAAVAWTVFNRFDSEDDYGKTVEEIIKAENQYAWRPGIEVPAWIDLLAHDVGEKWWAEKQSGEQYGRVIPSDYLWFNGDGRENYFRNQYDGGTEWDWSLPDPYKGWAQ